VRESQQTADWFPEMCTHGVALPAALLTLCIPRSAHVALEPCRCFLDGTQRKPCCKCYNLERLRGQYTVLHGLQCPVDDSAQHAAGLMP
jgi:hypothetical protein